MNLRSWLVGVGMVVAATQVSWAAEPWADVHAMVDGLAQAIHGPRDLTGHAALARERGWVDELLRYAAGEGRREDERVANRVQREWNIDLNSQRALVAWRILAAMREPRVVPLARRLLAGGGTLPISSGARVLQHVPYVLAQLGTPEARAVLEEAFERERTRLQQGGDARQSVLGNVADALRNGGDEMSLAFLERQVALLGPGEQWPRGGWLKQQHSVPLRARLVVEGKVKADAQAVEALRVLEAEATKWGRDYGERLEREKIAPLRALLIREGLVTPKSGGFQPLKTLPAGATALLEPATGAPR